MLSLRHWIPSPALRLSQRQPHRQRPLLLRELRGRQRSLRQRSRQQTALALVRHALLLGRPATPPPLQNRGQQEK